MSKRHFKKYFQWIGDTIYIRSGDKDTTTTLGRLLTWYHENQYDLDYSGTALQLRDLQRRHERLLDYLELEEITERNIIRPVAKQMEVRVASKPKKQAKGKRVSP